MGNLLTLPPKKDLIYDQWVENIPSLEGKTVAITGSTSGTGYWTAVAAIRKEASLLILLNRPSKRVEAAVERLTEEKEKYGSETVIFPVACDLQSFQSVREAAEEVNKLVKQYGGLNVLANNAGMMASDIRTKDGFEVQMQVNHLSHFFLTKLLFPAFESALQNGKEVRIVQHSSSSRNFMKDKLGKKYLQKTAPGTLGGNNFYHTLVRYHKTKLANSCFAMKLHNELKSNGFDITKIKSVVADPGTAGTDFGKNLYELNKNAGFLSRFTALGFFAFVRFIPMQSPADAALSLIESCFGSDVNSGDFFYPKETSTGVPFKWVSKHQVVPNTGGGDENQTLSEENQKDLWEASEEAIGQKFF